MYLFFFDNYSENVPARFLEVHISSKFEPIKFISEASSLAQKETYSRDAALVTTVFCTFSGNTATASTFVIE